MSDPPLRVCHIITGLERGGAETMLAKLCEAREPGIEHSVVSLRSGGPLAQRIRESGARLAEADLEPSTLPRPAAVMRLRRQIRAANPDVLQGWMYHGNLVATLFASRRVPVIWNIRQTLYDIARERPLTRLVIRSLVPLSRRPAAIIYNSSLSARQHEAVGYQPSKTTVIGNGFDTDRFAPSVEARRSVREELGLPAGCALIGIIARVHPMKDHATFFGAAAAVHAAAPDVFYVAAGEGATADGLAATVPDTIRGRVRFLGPRDDMPRVVAALDVVCLSSAWGEGFPNVLGEAMACGVPCVTTDVGDAAFVVGDTGICVPVADAGGMAEAVTKLLDDPSLRARLGAQARARVVERFSIARISSDYAELYRSVARRVRAGDT